MLSEKDEIKNLSVEDRLLLIEILWDSIDAEELPDEFDDSLKKELDERLERLNNGTATTISWNELKKKILQKN
jgi:putative addiction module component (TIGR02574 family)